MQDCGNPVPLSGRTAHRALLDPGSGAGVTRFFVLTRYNEIILKNFPDTLIPSRRASAVSTGGPNRNGCAHHLHRTLVATYKTKWFMFHWLREAMRPGDLAPFGSNGGEVEVDETFIGHDLTVKPKHTRKGRGCTHKHWR